MWEIYEKTKIVHSWLGPGTQDNQEVAAADSIRNISNFLLQQLGISVSELRSVSNIFQKLIVKNRTHLPLPNECEFSNDATWKSLIWFYSHPYFTRVRVIQEISASRERLVHCGAETVEWERVDIVAGYILMETAFSKSFGFTNTHCWWVSTMSGLTKKPEEVAAGAVSCI